MKPSKIVTGLALSALMSTTVLFPASDASADVVERMRLRVTCVDDGTYDTRGRLTDFTWTRNGNPLRIVDRTPVRCNNGHLVDPVDGDRDTAAIAVNIPPRANGYEYRVVAVDPLEPDDENGPGRTVCTGAVNFRNSVGDIEQVMDGLGEPADYLVQCHVGEGNRVIFRAIPFAREVAAPTP